MNLYALLTTKIKTTLKMMYPNGILRCTVYRYQFILGSAMAVYNHWTGLDWITGLSLKLRVYHCTITCDLFVQCMRQNTWYL